MADLRQPITDDDYYAEGRDLENVRRLTLRLYTEVHPQGDELRDWAQMLHGLLDRIISTEEE
jgi:hypothetical protein